MPGELVQRELARYIGELLVRRAVKPDPGDAVAIATGRGHLREILGFDDPLALAIDGATDNHAREPIRGLDASRRTPQRDARAPVRLAGGVARAGPDEGILDAFGLQTVGWRWAGIWCASRGSAASATSCLPRRSQPGERSAAAAPETKTLSCGLMWFDEPGWPLATRTRGRVGAPRHT